LVALAANLYFLFLDPAGTPDWVLAVIQTYHTQLALAAFVFLGILAALRTRPVRLDPEVQYRSLLVRDCALAATIVALLAGFTLMLVTALEATLFADAMRHYASQAAPKIVSYVNESRTELSDPPPPARVDEVRAALQPPVLQDLGRSLSNLVLRAILIGTIGGFVGAIRGRSGSEPGAKPGSPPER
jgi:hypothetical protein